jgi:hypothetical protein
MLMCFACKTNPIYPFRINGMGIEKQMRRAEFIDENGGGPSENHQAQAVSSWRLNPVRLVEGWRRRGDSR